MDSKKGAGGIPPSSRSTANAVTASKIWQLINQVHGITHGCFFRPVVLTASTIWQLINQGHGRTHGRF